MTVGVDVGFNGVIVDGAPNIKKFIGQPFANLLVWIRKQPGFRAKRLKAWDAKRKKGG